MPALALCCNCSSCGTAVSLLALYNMSCITFSCITCCRQCSNRRYVTCCHLCRTPSCVTRYRPAASPLVSPAVTCAAPTPPWNHVSSPALHPPSWSPLRDPPPGMSTAIITCATSPTYPLSRCRPEHPLSYHPAAPVRHLMSYHPAAPTQHPLSNHPPTPLQHPLSYHPTAPLQNPLSDRPAATVQQPLSYHPAAPAQPSLSHHPAALPAQNTLFYRHPAALE